MNLSKYTPALKPYVSHGLRLKWSEGNKGAQATCPFCGGVNKINIKSDTGQWKCWNAACISKSWTPSGFSNAFGFLRRVWEKSQKATTNAMYEELKVDRGLLGIDSVKEWGLCRSSITGNWLIPQFNEKGAMVNVCIYSQFAREKKPTVKGPAEMPVGFFRGDDLDDSLDEFDVCEGVWDGAAYAEAVKLTGQSRNIIALPGIDSWKPAWTKLTTGKKVNILFDNDFPKPGEKISPARAAIMRLVPKLTKAKVVNCIVWGKEGYSADLPKGCDHLKGV